jgi:hypothetical protein
LFKPLPRWAIWLPIVLAMAGGAIRIGLIARVPLWVDEAESSINALTILERGFPGDTYLGLPIFENTLIRPWQENAEYEFRDISYSDRGFAIYHGWLPLYLIAASFRAFGVTPDTDASNRTPVHSHDERRYRTVAARMPAVLTGTIAILVLFVAGSALFGWEAGLCAAVMASFWSVHIGVSDQARYYAPTLLLTSATGWLTWRLQRDGGWRDLVLTSVALACLFYTHLLTFAAMTGLVAVWTILSGRFKQLLILGMIVAVIIAPWLVLTGFIWHAKYIPSAWKLFRSPLDAVPISPVMVLYGALLGIGFGVLVSGAWRNSAGWLSPVINYLYERRRAVAFLYSWLFLGYVAFLFMPAVSFFAWRMGATLLAPITLLAGCILTSVAQLTSRSALVCLALGVLWVALSDWVRPSWYDVDPAIGYNDVDTAMAFLRERKLTPESRVYSSPNEHLILSFYSGIPVQSIAPVRKDFLDNHPGEVVIFMKDDALRQRDDPAHPDNVLVRARAAGINLSKEEAWEISWGIARDKQDLPAFAVPLKAEHASFQRDNRAMISASSSKKLVFRGFDIKTDYDWWAIYFYRFVNPQERHAKPAYRDRILRGTRYALPANWIVYDSPGSL